MTKSYRPYFSRSSTGCPICSCTWVGLTLIRVFHHLAQLPSHFCQISISPGRTGQTHSKFKSTQPSPGAAGTPCTCTVGRQLSRDVLLTCGSSGYQMGCTVAAVSAQRPVEHVKNALQNITTDGTPHSVLQNKKNYCTHLLPRLGLFRDGLCAGAPEHDEVEEGVCAEAVGAVHRGAGVLT